MDSEFRYNKLFRQWVLFAPKRAKKPFSHNEQTLQSNQPCPFDVENEHLLPNELLRIGDQKNFSCKVIPNLYNALSIDDEISSKKIGSFEQKSGFGAHEIIIETPNHNLQMFNFKKQQFFDYLSAVKLRVLDLKKDHRIKYFSIFKNHGIDAGASQNHSHSQIIATPFLPIKIKEDMRYFEEYKIKHERDFFDDLISDEINFQEGILFQNDTFIALTPFASKYPFEIIIISKKDISSIINFNDKDISDLSETMHFVFTSYFNALQDFSFNMTIKNGDIQNENNPNRFHILIHPRLFRTAGFEIDTDIFINTFLPEKAAKILKGKVD